MQQHRRSILGINHGKYFSFHNGRKFTLVTVFDPFVVCEIWGDAIRIVSVVIVGVTVRIDIAEIVRVVVIRGTLPPIRGRTQQQGSYAGKRFAEIHPYSVFTNFQPQPFVLSSDVLCRS